MPGNKGAYVINLTWNTQGRLARRPYRRLRWTLGLLPVVPVLAVCVAVANGLPFTHPLTEALITFAILVAAYVQYRYTQAMIRRLHDRDISGKVLIPLFLFSTILISFGISGALSQDFSRIEQITTWLNSGPTWRPLLVFIPFFAYTVFVGINMYLTGTSGTNRYGPQPDNQ